MLASSSGASRDDGRLVLFVLCQLGVVAVILALCSLTLPVQASSIAIGALAAVVPNALITLIMRNANPGVLVMFAMLRSFVVAFALILGFLVLEPLAMPYLIGAALGIGVITFVPVALTLLRPAPAPKSTRA